MISSIFFGAWLCSGLAMFSYLFWMDIVPKMHGRPSKIVVWNKTSAAIVVSFVGLLFAWIVSLTVEVTR